MDLSKILIFLMLVRNLSQAALDVKITTIHLDYWCVKRQVELFTRGSADLLYMFPAVRTELPGICLVVVDESSILVM